MTDIRKLLDLLARVPIMHVSIPEARARGDHQAVRYAEAVQRWRLEAEQAIEAADRPTVLHLDAYRRTALASELARQPS